MKLHGSVSGKISGGGKMRGSISYAGTIGGAISAGAPRNVYSGVYKITPKTSKEVVLDTAKKYLEQDITVLKVPFYQTSNEQGGTTIYIGDEVI